MAQGPVISVVIPALDEAENLPRTLASLAGQRAAPAAEVVVVDGGSGDGTPAEAARAGCRLVHGPRGRAVQMNRGAAAARGEVLLFLHADTTLHPDGLRAIADGLRDGRVVGGAMRLAIAGAGPALRLVAGGVNLRSRWLGLPYGDQGIFLRRGAFDRLGGYRPLPIMEDVDLVWRMRRLGRVALLRPTATTDGRRWRANGVARTTAVNWAAVALFAWGVPAGRVRGFYGRALRSRGGDSRGTAGDAGAVPGKVPGAARG